MPEETSKSRINSVDDEHPSTLANVRAEFAESLRKISQLEARVNALECDNSDLKFQLQEIEDDLKNTRAMLKGQTDSVAGPSSQPEPSQKRARSPSLEIVERLEPHRKKSKRAEIPTTPHATSKTRNRVMESVTILRTSPAFLKAESSSRPRPSSPTLRTAPKVVISLSTPPSDAPENSKKVQSQPSSPTPKTAVKSSPSVLKRGIIESEQNARITPQVAKRKASREDSPDDDASSVADSSPFLVAKVKSSPKEDKPKRVIKSKAKDVLILPDATVRLYLQSAQTFKITPAPLALQVPRAFLRLAYGGSDQQLLQYIQPDMNPSGPVQRRIVFPTLDLNPAMPSQPGEPGLIFTSRDEILSNAPWTLFCKLSSATPAVWHYLGEYENTLCGSMTAAQFKSQTPTVKKEWAKLVLKKKAFDVYVSMRARIGLRKSGAIPVENKEEEELLITSEMQAFRNDKGLRVTEEDVIADFSNGDEAIDIIRMTCVKYDHVFADDMKAKFANYDTLVAAGKRKKEEKGKAKEKAAANKASPKKQGRKPKALAQTQTQLDTLDVDEEGEGDLSGNSDEESVVPTGPSTSRGLRPRRSSRKSVSVEGSFTDNDDD